MAVSSILKASVCLTILISLSTATHADITSACQNACDEQTFFAACFLKCEEILAYVYHVDLWNQLPTENEDYDDSTEGLGSEKATGLGQPLHVMSRNDRSLSRANLLMNKFVRYGRSQPKSLRKPAQRRPNYLRVGRSDEVNGGDFEDEAKRASRFVRIGKSGIYEDDTKEGSAGFRSNQYEVDKKSTRPSKYVRIGKREAFESGHQTLAA